MRAELSSIRDLPQLHMTGHTCANLQGELFFVWGGASELERGLAAYVNARNASLWIYDTLSGYWRHRACSGDLPPSLSSATSALIGDKMYVFGGHSSAHDNWLNSLYCLDLTSFVWSDEGARAQAHPAKPIRCDKSSGWTHAGKLYVFAGYGWSTCEHMLELLDLQRDLQLVPDQRWPKFGWNNQLVEFDPKRRAWRWPSYSGRCPSARAAHSGALLNDRHYYLFGGRDCRQRLNDLYVLDVTTLRWTQLADFRSAPLVHQPAPLAASPNEAGSSSAAAAAAHEDAFAAAARQLPPEASSPIDGRHEQRQEAHDAHDEHDDERDGDPDDDDDDDDDFDTDSDSDPAEGPPGRSSLIDRLRAAAVAAAAATAASTGATGETSCACAPDCKGHTTIAASTTTTTTTTSTTTTSSTLQHMTDEQGRPLGHYHGLEQPSTGPHGSDGPDGPDGSDAPDGPHTSRPRAPPAGGLQAPQQQQQQQQQQVPAGRSFASFTNISDNQILLYGGISSQDKALDDCWLLSLEEPDGHRWTRLHLKHKLPRLWHTGARTRYNEVVIIGGSSTDKIEQFCPDLITISMQPKSLKRLAMDSAARGLRMRTIQRYRGLPPTICKLIKLRKQALALTSRRFATRQQTQQLVVQQQA